MALYKNTKVNIQLKRFLKFLDISIAFKILFDLNYHIHESYFDVNGMAKI